MEKRIKEPLVPEETKKAIMRIIHFLMIKEINGIHNKYSLVEASNDIFFVESSCISSDSKKMTYGNTRIGYDEIPWEWDPHRIISLTINLGREQSKQERTLLLQQYGISVWQECKSELLSVLQGKSFFYTQIAE